MGIIRDLVYSAIDSKTGPNTNMNQGGYNNNGVYNGPGPYNAGYASPAPSYGRRDRRRDRRNKPTIRGTLTDRFLGADPLVALNSQQQQQQQQQQQMMMMQQQQQQQQMFNNNNMQYQQGPPQQYNPQYSNQQFVPPQGQQMYSRDMAPQNISRDMDQSRDMPSRGFFDDESSVPGPPPPYLPDNRDQRRRLEKDQE